MSKNSNNNSKEISILLDSLVDMVKEKTGQDLNDLQITILKGAYYNEATSASPIDMVVLKTTPRELALFYGRYSRTVSIDQSKKEM